MGETHLNPKPTCLLEVVRRVEKSNFFTAGFYIISFPFLHSPRSRPVLLWPTPWGKIDWEGALGQESGVLVLVLPLALLGGQGQSPPSQPDYFFL